MVIARNTIDKEAANRFIKSALAANKDGNYLTKMAGNTEETATHKRFDEEDNSGTKKRLSDDSDIEEASPPEEQKKSQQKPKKKKAKSKK